MPVYEFEDARTGEPVEAFLPFAEAPEFGEVVSIEGRLLKRVVSAPQAPIVDHGFVSRQPARWHPDAPAHTPDGWCSFKSDKEAKDFCKRNSGDGLATMEFEVDD
jgi:hypothetical protein